MPDTHSGVDPERREGREYPQATTSSQEGLWDNIFGGTRGYWGSDGALPGPGEPPHALCSGFLRFVRIFAGKGGAGGGWCRMFPEAEPAAAALALGHGSPRASQRICVLPGGDRRSWGVIWGRWFSCSPQGFTGTGGRGGWGAKALSALPGSIPSRCGAAGAGVHNPTGSWHPHHRTRRTGCPEGLQTDPTPDPSTHFSWNGDAFGGKGFSPISPRFGANPQHRPSCDSGMGGCSSCIPGVKGLG